MTADTPPTPRRRRWPLRLATAIVLLLTAATLTAGALVGRPLVVPDWVAERIEARIADLVPGATIGFEQLRLVIGDAGLVRVRLDDAALRAIDGTPIAALSELEIAARLPPLLKGDVELREARVSGAFLTVRRAEDGRLGIGLGIAREQQNPSVPEVIAGIDAALEDPRLAALDGVTLDGLTIRFIDARLGREWLADGGQVSVERTGGDLRVSGSAALLGQGDSAASLSLNAESPIGATDASFGLSLDNLQARDIATQSPALAWLEALRAPISGALRGWTAPDGALGGLDATLRIGAGVLQPTEAAEPLRFEGAQTYLSYVPSTGRIEFTEIAVETAAGDARATGRAQIGAAEGGWPEAITGQFVLSDLTANPGGAFAGPVRVDRAELDLRLQLSPFQIDIGRLRIADPEKALRASGRVSAGEAGWSVRVDAQADRVTPDALAAHWPVALAPQTRQWVVERVTGGRARDATLALRWQPGNRLDLYFDLDFVDAAVQFTDTLPPVTDAVGRLVYDGDRLSARLEAGTLTPPEGGGIDLAGSAFVIPDTRQDPATGEIRLEAAGSATAALSLLDQPPLSLLEKAGRGTDLATGTAQVSGTIIRPLGPGVTLAETGLDLSGTLSGVESTKAVPGRRIAADTLELSVTDEAVRIAGAMTFDGVPFDGAWTRPLGEGDARIEGTARLSAAGAEALGVALPDGLISGAGPAQVRVDLPAGGAPRFRLTSELAGIGMAIPQVGWSLAPGTRGTLEIAGRLGDAPDIDTLRIDAGGLRTLGRVALRADGGLDRVSLDRVRVGSWFDAPVTLIGRGGAAPEVRVTGGRADLRGANFGAGGGGAGGGGGTPLRIALDTLTIAEGIVLRDFAGRFAARAGGLDGGFTAGMAGTSAALTGQLLPQNGGTGLRVSSEDAGNVLESTGILKTVAGGRMVLNLTPTGAPGTYDGAVTVTEARLRDAPAIGALLDAISIVGIIDQLEGPGIYFEEAEGRFRLSPDRVTLSQFSAVGPSMGVSVDGYVDLGSGQLDLQGVLSPIYVLNSIGSIFTRRGEGLLGFNFTVTGPSSQPRVAVNPLSVFTPGMFREIFRRPPPTAE
ncbi:YhdP family protein [Roseivivax sediminis]|uniref:YhdP central domain-containing protein n=1 Tax=Roseivivax sediminis TaxID=936889 RepID=A0A1I1Y5M3_9RHOB|nr:AsmA-like C-terminal region-containing protein [Roseivivax sediminis]SFE13140.1 Protein of unknown function [Roseivivax sediminis]